MQGSPRRLRAHDWRERLRDPRTVAAVLAVVLVVAFAAISISGPAPDVRSVVDVSPTPSPSLVVTTASPQSPTFDPLPDRTPAPPGATPEGVDRAAETSAPVSPPPPGTPTPTPFPNVWRFQGTVVDTEGKPLENVCVIIGPRGCRRGSFRTDERGHYYVDMPHSQTLEYDFFFELAGYEVVWHHAQPKGPTEFNVILRRL